MLEQFSLTSAYLGGDAHVLTVEGELDLATAPQLRAELAKATEEGAREVVVDLLRAPFVDSVGMGVLVETAKRLRVRGGALSIVSEDRRLVRIFEITGLDRVLTMHSTLREALEDLSERDVATLGSRA